MFLINLSSFTWSMHCCIVVMMIMSNHSGIFGSRLQSSVSLKQSAYSAIVRAKCLFTWPINTQEFTEIYAKDFLVKLELFILPFLNNVHSSSLRTKMFISLVLIIHIQLVLLGVLSWTKCILIRSDNNLRSGWSSSPWSKSISFRVKVFFASLTVQKTAISSSSRLILIFSDSLSIIVRE
jgi:hypothetical protein